MPLHHYLPAAFLGRFSEQTTGAGRSRSLHVARRDTARVYRAKAEKVAAVNDLYTLTRGLAEDGPDAQQQIDSVWQSYEGDLPAALDALTNAPLGLIDGHTWLRTLVPFVTSLFVRGLDFAARYEGRPTVRASGRSSPDNTNAARIIEFQRLLAPIMAARWVVMHASGARPVITNDLGLCEFTAPDHSYSGVAIPIDRCTVLGILPKRGRRLLARCESGWRAEIEHRELTEPSSAALGVAVARYAREFVAGPTAESLEASQSVFNEPPEDTPSIHALMGIRHRMLIAHEFEWHRLVSFLASGGASESLQKWDPKAVVEGPHSPVLVLPVNLPEFPTGLSRLDGIVYLWLDEVAGWTDTYSDGSGLGLPLDLP